MFVVSAIEVEENLKYHVSVDTPAEKFNMVSNNHGPTQNWDFSFLDWKSPF